LHLLRSTPLRRQEVLVSPGDEDVCAFSGHPLCGGEADAGVAAGDECRLAGKLTHGDLLCPRSGGITIASWISPTRDITLFHDAGFITKQSCRQRIEWAPVGADRLDPAVVSRQWVVLRQSIGHLAKHGLIAASGRLMPTTPFAYPQVISRRFAYCRVVKMRISAVQADFRDRFDSRQLHN
jgi:hypothetical protein